MDYYYNSSDEYLSWGSLNTYSEVREGHDYCSLVERRCRDFIHCTTAASA
jgi:hypothetical protein